VATDAHPVTEYGFVKSVYDPRYIELIGRLRAARRREDVTQRQLALRLGKSQSYVSKVETGERRVDLVELLVICEALGIPLAAVVPDQLRHQLERGPRGG
jgi:transcriptional regulator with XRE-family HTH domain